jgi:hypothetical protein
MLGTQVATSVSYDVVLVSVDAGGDTRDAKINWEVVQPTDPGLMFFLVTE